jgi:hypothetical protein
MNHATENSEEPSNNIRRRSVIGVRNFSGLSRRLVRHSLGDSGSFSEGGSLGVGAWSFFARSF